MSLQLPEKDKNFPFYAERCTVFPRNSLPCVVDWDLSSCKGMVKPETRLGRQNPELA
jgi:hypothetical protein